MRNLLGFFLLLSGTAFGFFAFYPDTPDREARLAEITEILAAPAGEVNRIAGETGLMRSFAPPHPVIIRTPSAAVAPSRAPNARVVGEIAPPAALATIASQSAAPPLDTGWQAVVKPDTGAVPSRVTSSTPGDGASRYELVLSIQRELKRAGCFGGTLSGSWTANTKRAMSAFMERVNATLPMDEPDYILLTLIKGQAAASCATCPTGQSLSDGRCVPNAVIAQKKMPRTDDRKAVSVAKRNDQGFSTTTAIAEADVTTTAAIPAPAAAPLPGRMGMGGPTPELDVRGGQDVSTEAWRTRVLPATGTRIPPVAAADPRTAATPSVAPAGAPRTKNASAGNASKNKLAALEPEEEAALEALTPQDPPGTPVAAPAGPSPGLPGTKSGTSIDGTGRVTPAYAAVPAVPAQRAGLPGSKSGAAVYGPNDPRAVYAPVPKPRAAPTRPRAASARPSRPYYGQHMSTRSVQNFFMHPLGRM